MRVITLFIAVTSGLLILGGYFFAPLASVQSLLLSWAIILAGAAVLAGFFNLILVHMGKIRRNEKGGVYSALLILSLIATFGGGLILRPDHAIMKTLLNGIVIPVEAALMGLLTISLLYAAIRLLRRRADMMSVVFLITVVFLIFGSATFPSGDLPIVSTLARWATQVLALGGARGILIGVALGSLTTALRVLFGADRPYGGN